MNNMALLALLLLGSLFTLECCAEGDRDDIWAEYAGNPLTEEDFRRALTLFRNETGMVTIKF